tara:strand:+ start:2461 stop:4329 length:1869 start_codon:yes stop_codon:yes gene_type:complete
MLAIITNKFRIHNAKSFIEGFSELDGIEDPNDPCISSIRQKTNIYLFIGKHTPWDSSDTVSGAGDLTNDMNPPIPSDTVQNIDFELWRNMIAAKKVNPSDVKHVIPRHDWSLNNDGSGKIYTQYDDLNKSLFNSSYSPFYVFTDDFNVYKCISNNYGSLSTVKPTGVDTSQMIETSDGYVWKYMYSISPADSLKFVTTSHIPVDTLKSNPNLSSSFPQQQGTQWDVQQSAIDGAIHSTVKIDEGQGYRGVSGKVFGDGTYDSSSDTTTFQSSQSDTTFTTGMIDDYFNDMSIFFNDSSVRRVFKIVDYTAPDLNDPLSMATFVVEGRADSNSPVAEDQIPSNSSFEIAPRISVEGDINNNILPADGIGFSAVARIQDDGLGNGTYKISSVEILSEGQSYRSCPLEFKMGGTPSISANYRAIISPKGGHGSDPIEELGGFYVMVNVRLEYDETLAELTVGNDYRQIGLIQEPIDTSTNEPAEDLIYLQSQSIELVLSSLDETADSLPFVADELITNGNGVYGKIIDFKEYDLIDNTTGVFIPDGLDDKKVLRIGNVFGKSGESFSLGDTITTVRGNGEIDATIEKVISESLVRYSGEVLYLEQRKPISRDIDQIEDIKIIAEF